MLVQPMAIEDYGLHIDELEELLRKISTNIIGDITSERLPPLELWGRAEASVASLRGAAESLRETMLILKPEIKPTIEKRYRALMQPLNNFRETLFQKSDNPLANSRLALEELRKALLEGSDFLKLAREIRKKPSETIMEILKLKEVSGAKEYLSTVPVPEVVYLRFAGLRKQMENLKLRVSDLERALEEVKTHIDKVQDEISKFRPHSIEEAEEKPAEKEEAVSEPTLVHED